MPSDKERMAAKRAGIAAWNSGGPGGGNTFPLEFAIDAAIDALSAAEKEREGEDGYLEYLKSSSERDAVREGDIIEKLREVTAAFRSVVDECESTGNLPRIQHVWELSAAEDFLNDLQEQSTPKEEA